MRRIKKAPRNDSRLKLISYFLVKSIDFEVLSVIASFAPVERVFSRALALNVFCLLFELDLLFQIWKLFLLIN